MMGRRYQRIKMMIPWRRRLYDSIDEIPIMTFFKASVCLHFKLVHRFSSTSLIRHTAYIYLYFRDNHLKTNKPHQQKPSINAY